MPHYTTASTYPNTTPERSPAATNPKVITRGVLYKLYRYNNFGLVPDDDFNARAAQASQSWTIQISAGNNWVMTQNILSDEIAAYRAVPDSGP